MKNIYPLAIALFLFASQTIVAQNNEPDIMAQQSHSEKIEKCRNLVYDKTFNSHDTATVHELLNYAKTSLETSGNLAFYLDEYRVLYLLNGFYPELLNSVKNEDDSTFYANSTYKIRPKEDLYLYQALAYIRKHQDALKDSVTLSTNITTEEKEFISLYINYVISHDREEINGFCDAYLTTNPEKPLETFTRKYMRYKYEPYHKFGGFCQVLGGTRISTNTLADIDNVSGDIGLGFGVTYRRFLLQTIIAGGFGYTHHELADKDVTLAKRSSFYNSTIQFYFGYKIPVISSWCVTPCIGMQRTTFSYSNDKKHDEIDFSVKGDWRPGFSVDICPESFTFRKSYSGWVGDCLNCYYTNLSLRYTILPTTFHMQSGRYSGISHCIDLVFNMGFSRARRVY